MTLTRWSPFQELASVQDRMNRLFSDAYSRGDDNVLTRGSWVPPVDIYQDGKQQLVVTMELPAMTRDAIDVSVENNTLTIRGEKKFEREVPEDSFHRIERTYGTFSRAFSLPPTIDVNQVGADFKDGVLTVTLPFREEAKPKSIKVAVQS